MGRLFSNLEPGDVGLQHRPGSFWGSTALVAGTTVGAGVLALPAVTFPAGLLPSTVLLVSVWLYALTAALLLVEVNVQTLCLLGRSRLGLLAMVEVALGQSVARMAAVAYVFLHYALLVAYGAQGGTVLAEVLRPLNGLPGKGPVGVGVFMVTFGGLLMVCPSRWVERCNQVFVVIVVATFMGLLGLGWRVADPANWMGADWGALPPAIAIMLVAVFYHTVIPVITTQLEGNVPQIRGALILGSAIPLVMFLLWNGVMLAALSPDMVQQTTAGIFDPLAVLRQGAAGGQLGALIAVFSEFAIATSFIGITYGLLDLWEDLWPTPPIQPNSANWSRYALIFIPTTSLAIIGPQVFFTALDWAGTFSISILAGILPAIMAYRLRMLPPNPHSETAVLPGGAIPLVLMVGLSLAIIFIHLVDLGS